ncbi:damage-inducible protein DinB [Cohnella pontilimi]|uniref:Damage-inducible protein DinB n=1 Tax=Cohnella pontilimi TaxID=2564100 RepID=A0A4U0FHD0_9BACL|nr:DinB family protein [Cohnella pontilimi]TJY42822.1 damage-inducible protein DinB [Cohnella pontilimi]
MQTMFQYNWLVREDWFDWCERIPHEELLKVRVGGVGGILKTLLHIVDVEYSWLWFLQGELEEPEFEIAQYDTLAKVRQLSADLHPFVESFVSSWKEEMDKQAVYVPWWNQSFAKGAILRHVIAHEIHHIGQLSVWSRELGEKPVSANVIGRGLLPVPQEDQ